MSIRDIIFQYKDALYCSKMLGGEQGIKRASDGKKSFREAVHSAAIAGLSEDESCSLLLASMHISEDDFLFTLKESPNFLAFSRAIDEAQVVVNKMKDQLNSPDGWLEFLFNTSLGWQPPVSETNLNKYTNLRNVMRDRLKLSPDLANSEVVLNVIQDYEIGIGEFGFYPSLTAITSLLSMALHYPEATQPILVGIGVAAVAISVSLTCGISLVPSLAIAVGAGLLSGGATFFVAKKDKELADSAFCALTHN